MIRKHKGKKCDARKHITQMAVFVFATHALKGKKKLLLTVGSLLGKSSRQLKIGETVVVETAAESREQAWKQIELPL